MRAQREGDVRRWWRPGLWLGGKWARDSWLAFICLYSRSGRAGSGAGDELATARRALPSVRSSRTLRGRCGDRAARVSFGHVA